MTFIKSPDEDVRAKSAASYTARRTRGRHEAERKDETIFIPLLFQAPNRDGLE